MAEEKKSILKLRIAKKAYVFDIRKKFSNVQRFGIKKKGGAFDIKDIGGMLRGKGAAKGAGAQAAKTGVAGAPAAAPQKGGILSSPIVKIAGAVVLVLIILFIGLLLILPRGGAVGAESKPLLKPSLEFSAVDTGVITIGTEEDASHAVYSVVSYKANDLKNATLSSRVYDTPMPTEVFVLEYPREGAESYGDFRKALGEELGRRGIRANDIDAEQMETLPASAVLVVPTGYVPSRLLGLEGGFNLTQLMDRGVAVVYIGQEFDKALDTGGTLRVGIQAADYEKFGVQFGSPAIGIGGSGRIASTGGFGLDDPLYVATAVREFGAGESRLVYGSASALKLEKGYFVFLPQTIDGGWRSNGSAAGNDVARLVAGYAWKEPAAYGEVNISTEGEEGKEGVFTIFSPPYKGSDSYTLFYFEGRDEAGGRVGRTLGVATKKAVNGELYSRDGAKVLPTSVSGERIRLAADLKESKAGTARLQLETLRNNEVVKSEPLRGDVNLQARTLFDYDVSIPAGMYVLKLVDDAGNAYAAGGVTIGDIEVVDKGPDWRNGVFKFDFRYERSPITVRDVKVSIDGKGEQQFSSVNTIEYKPGAAVKIETNKDYEFNFNFGTTSKKVKLRWAVRPQFYENPLVIFLGIVALVVAGAGMYLRRPETEMFGLDIPDFPPMSTIKVPVKKETVVGIFDQVNKDYSWERMPLKLEEIKNGFRKINFKGRPIVVGDYNLERILDRLIEKGLVRQELGYYGLKAWEEAKGAGGMARLAMFRQMRDVFVANVVRFTKLGEREDCDTLINVGQDIAVHIYGGDDVIGRALNTCGRGMTMIVFKDDDELAEFRLRLASTAPEAVGLKLEAQMGRLKLVSVGRLDGALKQMKA